MLTSLRLILLAILLALPIGLAIADDESPQPKAQPAAKAEAKGCACEAGLAAQLARIEKVTLTAQEKERVLYLRQEEKLARDVYRTLGKRWKLRPFENIGAAEQRHIEHLQLLLKHYGIADPVKDDTVGVFADPALKKIYDDLVKQGAASEVEALKAGMKIEDMDIADLRALIALPKANAHVRLVAHNLLKGSRNHLRAFARNLKARKGTYKAQHLTQEALDAIAASDHERGVLYDQDGKALAQASGGCNGGCGKGQGQGAGQGCGGGGCGKGQGRGAGQGRGKGCGGGGCGKGRGKGPGRRGQPEPEKESPETSDG